ncbi:hypothetical protein EC036_00910 [Enterobacter cloacae]|nr:hypothetical protein EC036_00910 [Enterobacter cloacae]
MQRAFSRHGLPNYQGDHRGTQDFSFHVVTPHSRDYWDNAARVAGVHAP